MKEYIWRSHDTRHVRYMNRSDKSYRIVVCKNMSDVWRSIYEGVMTRVMSDIWMSHVDIWTSHVRYMDESCHIDGSSRGKDMDETCHTCRVIHMHESCHTHERVTVNARMSHDRYINESCHIHGLSHVTHMDEPWVVVNIWMSHVTRGKTIWMSHVRIHGKHMNESCWFVVKIWMSHVTGIVLRVHVCGMTHAYAWVMQHTWTRHRERMNEYVRYINESCQIYKWVKSHTWIESW